MRQEIRVSAAYTMNPHTIVEFARDAGRHLPALRDALEKKSDGMARKNLEAAIKRIGG